MIQQKALYIFLAKRTVWFWFAGKRNCFKPVSKPLNSENILEHYRKWSASRIILFLEFPWVLTYFDITITLSSEELASFTKMRLSLANKADTGERSVRAKQSRNPVNAVDLFIKLSKMSETAHVQLKSQQKSRIKGHEVIRFILAIELAPPTIKQTLNLNNQK